LIQHDGFLIEMRRVCFILLILANRALAGASDLSVFGADEKGAVLAAINSIRIREGLHVLVHEEPASLAAKLHAQELAERNLLSHRSLSGKRVAERYRFSGGTGTRTGENLGAGESVESILHAWMGNPSHRDNLLNPEWYNVGLGQAQTEKKRVVLVAIFSNSRWKYSSLEIDGEIATLSGQLIHPEGIKLPEISIRIDGNEIGPVPAKPGTKRRVFSFPAPQLWQEGRVVPILLSVREHGITKQVDLLLPEVP